MWAHGWTQIYGPIVNLTSIKENSFQWVFKFKIEIRFQQSLNWSGKWGFVLGLEKTHEI